MLGEYVTCFPELRFLQTDMKCNMYQCLFVHITILRTQSKTFKYCKHQHKVRQQIDVYQYQVAQNTLSKLCLIISF
jgi:hypothetical protein